MRQKLFQTTIATMNGCLPDPSNLPRNKVLVEWQFTWNKLQMEYKKWTCLDSIFFGWKVKLYLQFGKIYVLRPALAMY